jgi:hypothetical protein
MKRLFVMSITFFSLVFFSGCIEFNMKVKVNPDGSGTITEEVLFSQKFVQMMKSFSQMGGEDSEPFNMFDPDDLKKKEKEFGEGVELVKSEKLERKRMTGYSAVYRFKDINKLKVEDDPASKMPEDIPGQEAEESEPPYTFTFKKGNPAPLQVHFNTDVEENFESDDENESGSDAENDMMFQQMKDMMSDMKTSIVLELGHNIVSTNATYVDDNKITLVDLNFGAIFSDPDKLEEFKKMKMKNFHQAKEFLSGIPGIKIEFNKELQVKFK